MPQRVSAARSELKATQQRVLDAVEHDGATKLTRGLYEEIAGVSRSQAAYDLAELVSAGILERVGGGRSTWYRVVRTERNGQRHWTNDRIRSALEQFCDGRDTWPSASEFKAAGHSDLYVAASRYGGISFWTNELGFSRPARTPAPVPAADARANSRAAATVAPEDRLGSRGRRLRGGAVRCRRRVVACLARQLGAQHRVARHDPRTPHSGSVQRREVQAPARTHRVNRSPQRSTHTAKAELAVRTVSAPASQPASSSSTRTVVRTQPSHTPSGPVPLPSPIGTGGGPAPLPPPGG